MQKSKGETEPKEVNTVKELLSPALHDGRRGVPAIFTIGAIRFASDVPKDIQHAAEINETLQAIHVPFSK